MNHVDMTPPLSGVTVVDMTTALGEYAGRLLADLGADVIRYDDAAPTSSHRRAFMNAGKQIRGWRPRGEELTESLLQAQILLTSEGPAALRANDMHPRDVARRHPMLVHVAISPFGLTGPYADRPASDLTLMAAGGLLALAGEPDREPVRAWGQQTAVIAGVHATTATLIALHVLETESRGQIVDLSVRSRIRSRTPRNTSTSKVSCAGVPERGRRRRAPGCSAAPMAGSISSAASAESRWRGKRSPSGSPTAVSPKRPIWTTIAGSGRRGLQTVS